MWQVARRMGVAAAVVTMVGAVMVAAAGMEEQEQGGITVEDNGYRNVLVAVSQNVSEEESGERIINDIKEAMTALSQTMLRATQRRLYVAEVTILLPITWRNTQQYQEATTETYLNSKVRVLPPNPIYGDQPFTVQPGGCGEPGLYLHLTPRYLGDGDVACRWGDKVTSYQFLLTTHFSSMPDNPLLRLTYPKDNATNSTTLLRLPFGHPANFTLDLPTTLFEKRLYFLALRSKNKAGETSKLSNVVRLVLVKKPAENDNKGNTTGGDGAEVEGGGVGGGPSLPLTSLSESGIGWDDVAYVCVLIFFLLTCMW